MNTRNAPQFRDISGFFGPCLILLAALVPLFCMITPSEASWAVDPARFHASVHGQISCQDCHGDVTEREMHPDPLQVTKRVKDFFHFEECLACHDSIMDDLEAGMHGSRKVKSPDSYQDCLRCHNPHYQISITDPARKKFKPARPVKKQCGACHETRNALPSFSEADAACLICHRSVAADDPREKERINALCLHCHGMSGTRAQAITQEFVPLIDAASHEDTAHAEVACTTCHKDAASYTHDVQKPRDCGQCHLPHDEKTAGSAHMRVSCRACHLKGGRAVRDAVSNCILWERGRIRMGNPLFMRWCAMKRRPRVSDVTTRAICLGLPR
ncbi:MAG: cytochrome c3 family protein [Deltaproteobacteria bacterium]|nr:cytochrome c3 family protein [Deltaproteobacteria bacterium]